MGIPMGISVPTAVLGILQFMWQRVDVLEKGITLLAHPVYMSRKKISSTVTLPVFMQFRFRRTPVAQRLHNCCSSFSFMTSVSELY